MTTQQKPGLDARLVNPIIAATTDVLATMSMTNVTLVTMRAEADYKPTGDVSAVIGLQGDDGEGMIALSFPLKLSNLLIARLLGCPPEHLSRDDRSDGVGELANMISGNAKTALSEMSSTPYRLSIPTVVLGPQHEVSSRPRNNPYLIIIFEAEGEQFHLQVSFKSY